jgi:hypothetical protein
MMGSGMKGEEAVGTTAGRLATGLRFALASQQPNVKRRIITQMLATAKKKYATLQRRERAIGWMRMQGMYA